MEQLKIHDKFHFTAHELALSQIDFVQIKQGHFHCLFQNKSYNIELLDHDSPTKTIVIKVNGHLYNVSGKDRYDILLEKMGITSSSQQKHSSLKAPMPGLVLDIRVEAGQEVKKGDTLLVLEAMKMENSLKSPHDGQILSVEVVKGKAVEKGQLLLHFK